eukprot:tig00000711_g3376.t1
MGLLIGSVVFVALALCVLTAAIAYRSGFKAGGKAELAHVIQSGAFSASGSPVPAGARPRNVVLMIPDGTGPASWTLARDVARALRLRDELFLDGSLTGASRTRSNNSLVTDSAAGATAFSCAQKTLNGAISVLPDGRRCGTLFEAAQAKGMATGIVVTTRLTHATPACFGAHVADRDEEEEIASQLATSRIDLMLGGGRRFFEPKRPGAHGGRRDGRDLPAEMKAAGYSVLRERAALDAPLSLPAVGLFAWDHMDYEIDRRPEEQPSLREMTAAALAALRTDGRPFILMVEGSRVDHAAHANDAQAHARDLLAFDEAAGAVLADTARHGDTLLVAVADHECGGLTLGRDGLYAWYAAPVATARASNERLASDLAASSGAGPGPLAARIRAALDCPDGPALAGAAAAATATGAANVTALEHRVGALVSGPARLAWTSGGHTGVDVHVHSAGPGSERFRGTLENAEVGRRIAELLGLDLEAATRRLAPLPPFPASAFKPPPDAPNAPQ